MPRHAYHTHSELIAGLREFVQRENRLPGYNEMMSLFGYKSKNTIYRTLNQLTDEGFIYKDESGKIAPADKLLGTVRYLGEVQAGIPVEADPEAECMVLDRFLSPSPRNTYMLKVHGDSMIDAGICEGDYVLVETDVVPKEKDIVVANVDGEWTLKYYMTDEHGVVLMPANPKYEPIRARLSLRIAGVVRSGIRRFFNP